MEFLLLLRYGTLKPNKNSRPILNMKVIARTLKISTFTVSRLLKLLLGSGVSKVVRTRGVGSKFRPNHIRFLTRPSTLTKYAGLSLLERTKMFHR